MAVVEASWAFPMVSLKIYKDGPEPEVRALDMVGRWAVNAVYDLACRIGMSSSVCSGGWTQRSRGRWSAFRRIMASMWSFDFRTTTPCSRCHAINARRWIDNAAAQCTEGREGLRGARGQGLRGAKDESMLAMLLFIERACVRGDRFPPPRK